MIVNDELENMWQELIRVYLRYHYGVSLEELERNTQVPQLGQPLFQPIREKKRLIIANWKAM
jgi:hypothetical protein